MAGFKRAFSSSSVSSHPTAHAMTRDKITTSIRETFKLLDADEPMEIKTLEGKVGEALGAIEVIVKVWPWQCGATYYAAVERCLIQHVAAGVSYKITMIECLDKGEAARQMLVEVDDG